MFYALLGVGVVNTVVSAGYYLRVLRAAGLDDPDAKDEKGEADTARGPARGGGVRRAVLAVLHRWWSAWRGTR